MARDRRATAFQEFLVETKQQWMTDVFGALRRDYAQRATARSIGSPEDVAAVMHDSTLYPFYAWLERHIQRTKYSGRWGLMRITEPLALPHDQPRLELDPTIEIPAYYDAMDVHQHPGHLHGDDRAGTIYKASAQSTQPGATRGYALHERVTDLLAAQGTFRRVLDMGCGFGKSSLPIAQRFKNADVEGIDLSAPCLRVAAAEAGEAQARNLTYRQMNLARTRYDDASFDLVTSTMVLHELDEPTVRATIEESWRLLEPGGTVVHLDFLVEDPFLTFIHYGHGRRNNEPFMEGLNRMGFPAALEAAGFRDVQVVPFAERDGALDPAFGEWRFPWTAIVARKPGEAA